MISLKAPPAQTMNIIVATPFRPVSNDFIIVSISLPFLSPNITIAVIIAMIRLISALPINDTISCNIVSSVIN